MLGVLIKNILFCTCILLLLMIACEFQKCYISPQIWVIILKYRLLWCHPRKTDICGQMHATNTKHVVSVVCMRQYNSHGGIVVLGMLSSRDVDFMELDTKVNKIMLFYASFVHIVQAKLGQESARTIM